MGSLLLLIWCIPMLFYGLGAVLHGAAEILVVETFTGVGASLWGWGMLVFHCGLLSHVVQQYVMFGSVEFYRVLRKILYWFGGGLLVLGWAVGIVSAVRYPAMASWALNSQAEAPLWPTAITLKIFIFGARDSVVVTLQLIGLLGILFFALFQKLKLERVSILGICPALFCLAVYFLGDAAYQFVITRQLGVLRNAPLYADYLKTPGLVNAWIVFCQTVGWISLSLAAMFLYLLCTDRSTDMLKAAEGWKSIDWSQGTKRPFD